MAIEIKLEKHDDDFWIAWVPTIPGCISQGKTKKEAEKNIKKAMDLHLEGELTHG